MKVFWAFACMLVMVLLVVNLWLLCMSVKKAIDNINGKHECQGYLMTDVPAETSPYWEEYRDPCIVVYE